MLWFHFEQQPPSLSTVYSLKIKEGMQRVGLTEEDAAEGRRR